MREYNSPPENRWVSSNDGINVFSNRTTYQIKVKLYQYNSPPDKPSLHPVISVFNEKDLRALIDAWESLSLSYLG